MMTHQFFKRRAGYYAAAMGGLLLVFAAMGGARAAQREGAPGRTAPASAKAGAVIDVTGYWVSIVDEDWVWRMMTPAKGDYTSAPLNAEGRRVTDAWDPAKDEADGNQCKAYGAGGIMRMPERLHIFWVGDNTLEMDIDAGTQKRLFHFDGSKWQGGDPQLQGDSVATWEKQVQRRAGTPFDGPQPGKGGNLHVVTTHMKPGYLEKNGVPYSGNAVLNEHFTVIDLHGAAGYLILTSVIEDPTYLREPFLLSTQFKREPDSSKWDPTPCRPLWPMSLRAKLGQGAGPVRDAQ
ncbi:MAG: hypothetical protein ABSA57_16495 [Candidatus Acidiferrales bacterium]|jgi:hypothetical protein